MNKFQSDVQVVSKFTQNRYIPILRLHRVTISQMGNIASYQKRTPLHIIVLENVTVKWTDDSQFWHMCLMQIMTLWKQVMLQMMWDLQNGVQPIFILFLINDEITCISFLFPDTALYPRWMTDGISQNESFADNGMPLYCFKYIYSGQQLCTISACSIINFHISLNNYFRIIF